MKKLLFKLFFALTFTSISLHGQEKIQQVEVHIFGGMALYSSRYTLNSLKKEFSAKPLMGQDEDLPKEISLSNTPKNWEAFTKKINLDKFKKLRDGPSEQAVDGQDKVIIIKTNKKTYRKMNAYGNDRDREVWYDLLQIIAKEFGKKSIYE
ncbi:MAG: hypothetical protein HG446_001250 [Flavobacteriaceae bacterium]|nr:hypothetical protein [Flavobacteriaceae bacterium]